MSLAGGNRGDVLASAREELTLWRIHPLVATSLFVLPFAGAAALAGLREGALFDFLIREDSLLEWLQVAGLCGAVLFAARIATSLGRVGEVPLAGAYGLLALGCALVLGEELSWGQRLLDLQAPERLGRSTRAAASTSTAFLPSGLPCVSFSWRSRCTARSSASRSGSADGPVGPSSCSSHLSS